MSRTQAACWFFLVTASYLFIGMITGDFSTSVTATVLGLLGISAGTAVGASFVDASKATPADAQGRISAEAQLRADVAALDQTIHGLQAQVAAAAQGAPVDALNAQLEQKRADKAEREAMLAKLGNRSQGFIFDISSDVNGVNFHRFQIAWTIVLGIIFLHDVYKGLAMPKFDAATLGLLGISAGTYLGLKIPEPTTPTTK